MKVIKNLIPYVIIIVVVVLIRTFIITPANVDGPSMDPTLQDKEIILIKKFDKKVARFDVMIFNYEGERLIKRVIGLPGDHISYQYGNLYINENLVKENFEHSKTNDFELKDIGFDTIPKDHYFVLGDNREVSKDSRMIGLIAKKDIIGSTNFAIFPFSNFGSIK